MQPVTRTAVKSSSSRATRGPKSDLGEWIRGRRAGQAISQRELAARAGISRSYLCDIERGRGTQPSIDTLDRIAGALGTDRTELLGVAGILEPRLDDESSQRERRLLAVYRGLSTPGQDAIERFARFLHADEQRWVQIRLLENLDEPTPILLNGPTLFDVPPTSNS